MALKKTTEHKLTDWEKFLFGVLNTNLFSGNNSKRTSFSSPNKILLQKARKMADIFAKLQNFVVGLAEKVIT
jgi:hypothetical protein